MLLLVSSGIKYVETIFVNELDVFDFINVVSISTWSTEVVVDKIADEEYISIGLLDIKIIGLFDGDFVVRWLEVWLCVNSTIGSLVDWLLDSRFE